MEIPFIERELGFCVDLVNPISYKTSPEFIRIASANPEIWKEILLRKEERSVVFILLGNETYSENEYRFLATFNSIKSIYAQYPPRKSNIFGLLAIASEILQQPNLLVKSMFYRTLKNSIDFSKRNRQLSKKLEINSFPQGYSRRFLDELSYLHLLPEFQHASLLDPIFLENFVKESRKGFFFVGQPGSWYRKEILKRLQSHPDFIYKVTDGWAGEGQGEKIDFLLNMITRKGVLCPPGNLANSTCRYWEGIITSCLPITTSYTIQDHHHEHTWVDFLPKKTRLNYSKVIKLVLSLKDVDRAEILKKEQERLRLVMTELRESLV